MKRLPSSLSTPLTMARRCFAAAVEPGQPASQPKGRPELAVVQRAKDWAHEVGAVLKGTNPLPWIDLPPPPPTPGRRWWNRLGSGLDGQGVMYVGLASYVLVSGMNAHMRRTHPPWPVKPALVVSATPSDSRRASPTTASEYCASNTRRPSSETAPVRDPGAEATALLTCLSRHSTGAFGSNGKP